jgi:hypothetical protein
MINKNNYQIDWDKLAKYNCVFVHMKRDPMEDVNKTDELLSWMKEYPDAMEAINTNTGANKWAINNISTTITKNLIILAPKLILQLHRNHNFH